MTIALYAHPFSSYCQKALIALYENDTPFTFKMISPEEEQNSRELAELWPIGKFPVLTDGDRTVPEATIIIEYLDLHHAGPVRMIPADRDAAIDVRLLDRFFDNYVMTPMNRIVFDFIRPEEARDPLTVKEARAQLDVAYAWLDRHMAGREWAAGDGFTLADCAAAPSLFYADWCHAMAGRFPHAEAYRARLLARPSFARAVDEARPYRRFFPPGAPDRD